MTELARLEREQIIANCTRKTASAPPQPNTEAERQTFVDPMSVYGYRSATTYSQPRCADTSGNGWRPFKFALPDLRSSVLPPISDSVFNPDQMTLDASHNLFSQDCQVSQEPIIRTDLPTQSQDLQQMPSEGIQPGNAPPEFTLEGADARQLASFLDTITTTDVGTTPVGNQDSG